MLSNSESLSSAKFRFPGFLFPILRGRASFERAEKTSGNAGDFLDSGEKGVLVGVGRFGEAADLPHELERSRTNLFIGNGRIEVEQSLDIPAHDFNVADSTAAQIT